MILNLPWYLNFFQIFWDLKHFYKKKIPKACFQICLDVGHWIFCWIEFRAWVGFSKLFFFFLSFFRSPCFQPFPQFCSNNIECLEIENKPVLAKDLGSKKSDVCSTHKTVNPFCKKEEGTESVHDFQLLICGSVCGLTSIS